MIVEPEIKNFVEAIGAIDLSNEAKKFFNRPNYFKFPNTQTLIAVKISRSAKPFFGIDERIIDVVNKKMEKFYLVLLVSDHAGWVFSKDEVNVNIKHGFWKCNEKDKNYKINYGDLNDKNLFSSQNQFLNLVYERGGKGI